MTYGSENEFWPAKNLLEKPNMPNIPKLDLATKFELLSVIEGKKELHVWPKYVATYISM